MVCASLGEISNIYFSNLERWKLHFQDKITKQFYCGGGCNAKLNYLKFIAINRTIQPLQLNINKWNLKVLISDFCLCVSVSYPFAQLWIWEYAVFSSKD